MTALEIAWRWLYGVPALVLFGVELRKVLLVATSGTMDAASLGLDRVLLNDPVGALSADPVGAAGKFASAAGAVWPGLERAAVWLVPVLVVGWVLVSAVGRTVVLRRVDGRLHARVGTLMTLHAVRVLALASVFALWLWAVRGSGHFAVTGPIASGAEPNLVLYCGMVIALTLGIFVAWGTVSWVFSLAPLVAMLDNLGPWASLRAAATREGLRGKLVEVNLVLGIVKIALLVLAMVFSATPLPFESVTTPGFLATWWAGVAVLYVLWSDFFHVARLVAYLNLWRAYEGPVG